MNKEIELPQGVKLNNLLEKLRVLSWGAADILIAYSKGKKPPHGFPEVLDVNEGSDGPFSAADLAVNSWMLEGLKSFFPNVSWSFISEENSKENLIKDCPVKDEWIWILDPLDGTKDFLQGTGEYAVHLALLKDNVPVLGIVLIPEAEELWIGLPGKGAWCENRLEEHQSFDFSNRNEISEMVLVASRSHRNRRLEKLIEALPITKKNKVGSVGCKIIKILKGEADFYISLSGETAPKDWDMAAPDAVLTAGGGKFSHLNSKPLSYNKDEMNQWGCLVASNGNKHDLLCTIIKNELLIIDSSYLM